MSKITSQALRAGLCAASIVALATASTVAAKNWDDWSAPASIEALPGSSSALNSAAIDGCATHSPDGLTIVFNSNRTGKHDLYMATRSSTSEGFGAPVPLPAPVNDPDKNDACATIATGKRLYFSSDREDAAYDIYVTRQTATGWTEPVNLGPHINRDGWLDETPTFYEDEDGNEVMLFSSRLTNGTSGKIYESVNGGPATPIAGGPHSSASDNRPSVTRDGLTIFFDSTRSGGLGGPDLYYATRSRTSDPFGPANHLQSLSSQAFDARPYISKDGTFLTFGSGRSGSESGFPDTWYTVREKRTGK